MLQSEFNRARRLISLLWPYITDKASTVSITTHRDDPRITIRSRYANKNQTILVEEFLKWFDMPEDDLVIHLSDKVGFFEKTIIKIRLEDVEDT